MGDLCLDPAGNLIRYGMAISHQLSVPKIVTFKDMLFHFNVFNSPQLKITPKKRLIKLIKRFLK